MEIFHIVITKFIEKFLKCKREESQKWRHDVLRLYPFLSHFSILIHELKSFHSQISFFIYIGHYSWF